MKIGAISLGCDKNRVDTEKMLARLVSGGHTLVGNEEDADVIIVNTCAFTDDAKSEAIDEILSAVGHKKHSKKKKIIVTGCLPQRYMETLEEILEFLAEKQLTRTDVIVALGGGVIVYN